jgi:hypothetical protein
LEYPSDWFLDEQNAVYATIPDPFHPEHQNNRHLQDFHQLRHLSRYEIALRQQQNVSLERGWNGIYDFRILGDLEKTTTWTGQDDNRNASRNLLFAAVKSSEDVPVTATTMPYGGIFDNYQAVPLSQGYGTHFANIWVGSPTPQRKTVIVDTGSHYTAFPCSGCINWYV